MTKRRATKGRASIREAWEPFDGQNCAVIEETADGRSVGRCQFYVGDNDVCPRHGDVSAVQARYRAGEGLRTWTGSGRAITWAPMLSGLVLVPSPRGDTRALLQLEMLTEEWEHVDPQLVCEELP